MKAVGSIADVLAIEAASTRPPSSTHEAIRLAALRTPEAPALTFFMDAARFAESETWTYRELLDRIDRTADAFRALGLGADEVVAYVLPNLPETHLVVWGGEAAGIVAAFNPLLEAETLGRLLEASGARILVTLAPFPGVDLWSRLRGEIAGLPRLRHVVLVDMTTHLAEPLRSALRARLGGAADLREGVPAHVEIHDFHALIAAQPPRDPALSRDIPAERRSSMFCTGGTTGLPKIAVRRHGNEVANAVAAAAFFGDAIGPGTTLFCGLPLFHVNGVLVTGLLPFSRGAHVVLGTPQGYRGEGVVANFWKIVAHWRINFFSGVPTLYTALLQVPVGEADISSLRYGLCGAAPLPIEVFRAFEASTGIRLLEGYGLTEGACVSSVNPPEGERRIGSIGIRLPHQEMKTVVLDAAGAHVRDCAADEVGVIAICGPNVFEGYLAEEQNRGLWIDCGDGKRWLNTGDLGRFDADGYFRLTGRQKELIIRGGHNIDPAAIEEPLHAHPAVMLVAALGRPDVYAGELPVAYVQLRPGASVGEDELMDFARARIGERAALPRHIRIVPQIPTTAVGKIFKPALKHLEIRDAVATALTEAGVAFVSLNSFDDAARGSTLELVLADEADEARAGKVLGGFPYPFAVRRAT